MFSSHLLRKHQKLCHNLGYFAELTTIFSGVTMDVGINPLKGRNYYGKQICIE